MSSLHPLLVFPKVVWEKILEKLEHPSDVLNVFKAFPILDALVLKNCDWLIDQVVPFISPWLGNQDLLNCRLVRKLWAQGFDQLMEQYQPDGFQNREQLDLSKEASRRQKVFRDNLRFRHNSHNYRCYKKSERFAEFEQKMQNRPPARNPFIGRDIHLFNCEFNEPRNAPYFWNDAIDFLEEFGDQIWSLHLRLIGQNDDFSTACYVLINSLTLLPNLRMLEIYVPAGSEVSQEEVDVLEASLATIVLPNLETLLLANNGDDGHPFNNLLVKRFSSQIRKLRIWDDSWREEYSQILPNLTELIFTQTSGSLKKVANVLASLSSLQLLRLELGACIKINRVHTLGSHIGSFLKPFPQLLSLRIHVNVSDRSGFSTAVKSETKVVFSPKAHAICITSLKSLTVKLWGYDSCELANFDFLQYFPNLEYIHIKSNMGYRVCYFHGRSPYDPKIWEGMLPKLKELNLLHLGIEKCFTRARYEWFTSRRSDGPTDSDVESSFEDFNRMVAGHWGSDKEALNKHPNDTF